MVGRIIVLLVIGAMCSQAPDTLRAIYWNKRRGHYHPAQRYQFLIIGYRWMTLRQAFWVYLMLLAASLGLYVWLFLPFRWWDALLICLGALLAQPAHILKD